MQALKERTKLAKLKRKKERMKKLLEIQNDQTDEIAEIMSNNKQQQGAFCTILFTVCFILHFLLEIGVSFNGSHYSMQSVISDHFENRIMNIDTFHEASVSENETNIVNITHRVDDL